MTLSDGSDSIDLLEQRHNTLPPAHLLAQQPFSKSCRSASCSGWVGLDGTERSRMSVGKDAGIQQFSNLLLHGIARSQARRIRGGGL